MYLLFTFKLKHYQLTVTVMQPNHEPTFLIWKILGWTKWLGCPPVHRKLSAVGFEFKKHGPSRSNQGKSRTEFCVNVWIVSREFAFHGIDIFISHHRSNFSGDTVASPSCRVWSKPIVAFAIDNAIAKLFVDRATKAFVQFCLLCM